VCRPPAGMRAWLTTRRTEGTSHSPAQMIIMPVSKETVCDLRQRLAEHSTYNQPLQIPLLHILQGPRLPVRPSYGGNSLTRSELRREAPSGPASTAIGDVVGTRGAELSPGHPRSDAARLKHSSPLSGPPVLRSETSWEHGVPNFPPATHAQMQRGSSTHLRCPARQYCDRRRRGNTGCRTFPRPPTLRCSAAQALISAVRPASTAIGDVVGTRGAELSPGHPRSDAARLKHSSPLPGPPVLRSETSWEHGVPNFPPATHAPHQGQRTAPPRRHRHSVHMSSDQ
ncbi:Hypothetical protein GSB_155013, partial [Giardia duodenalis]